MTSLEPLTFVVHRSKLSDIEWSVCVTVNRKLTGIAEPSPWNRYSTKFTSYVESLLAGSAAPPSLTVRLFQRLTPFITDKVAMPKEGFGKFSGNNKSATPEDAKPMVSTHETLGVKKLYVSDDTIGLLVAPAYMHLMHRYTGLLLEQLRALLVTGDEGIPREYVVRNGFTQSEYGDIASLWPNSSHYAVYSWEELAGHQRGMQEMYEQKS